MQASPIFKGLKRSKLLVTLNDSTSTNFLSVYFATFVYFQKVQLSPSSQTFYSASLETLLLEGFPWKDRSLGIQDDSDQATYSNF